MRPSTVEQADGVTAPRAERESEGEAPSSAAGTTHSLQRPRIGFLGTGWIGRHRMEAIHRSGVAQVVALHDPAVEAARDAAAAIEGAEVLPDFDHLLAADLDGIVIATPSALHAEQSIAALERGYPVFCQKPLGRTARETAAVVEVARRNDLLLEVDLSYRFTEGMQRIRETVQNGEIGEVYAADLAFHNAYGPDKEWFYDVSRSGGGCVMDLGIHLVDLALWVLEFPAVEAVTSRLFAGGAPLGRNAEVVEDFGTGRLDLSTGAAVQFACSWRLPAGRDARIQATFYGTEGGLRFRNVNGSFYDFVAERFHGTSTETLTASPDDWGGRAAVHWAERLARGDGFDGQADRLVAVAAVLDEVYGR